MTGPLRPYAKAGLIISGISLSHIVHSETAYVPLKRIISQVRARDEMLRQSSCSAAEVVVLGCDSQHRRRPSREILVNQHVTFKFPFSLGCNCFLIASSRRPPFLKHLFLAVSAFAAQATLAARERPVCFLHSPWLAAEDAFTTSAIHCLN